ncbi:MAG: hypothetical protein B7Z44_09035 [Caulobacter sp. 12-67-6]|nr:MAG: hypothetical protein B7Z44_09035 [Caulobacter sp. 12-67-6]OYX70992.1 MAG: hypothetical protein B7Y81_10380 [Caulobacter sp. 32-67-35]OYX91692.1 MAG: hypothetical protein B7Y78_11700 [Caulobacter sp. 35-67-4]HQR88397.1 hypothetical protein [Caulobacter sp.]
MRQSTWIAVLATVGVMALTGCQRTETARTDQSERRAGRDPVRVISRLDCPENQGDLKRVSVAADGLSCAYAGIDAEVQLRLVSLNGGDAEDALAPIEADLKTLMPSVTPVTELKAGDGRDRNKTSIHLPGVRIDASDGGADIKIGNITINSNEGGASEVKINKNVTARTDEAGDGAVSIRASDDGAEVRHSKRGDSIRSTLILASDKATSSYRVVGYEARGPKEGPLAIATIKAKNRDSGDHDVFNDMKALVRHNVGG